MGLSSRHEPKRQNYILAHIMKLQFRLNDVAAISRAVRRIEQFVGNHVDAPGHREPRVERSSIIFVSIA